MGGWLAEAEAEAEAEPQNVAELPQLIAPELRFNLKVFKAIHHIVSVAQRQDRVSSHVEARRLQLDMSAAICYAIAQPNARRSVRSSPRGALYWPVTREQFDVSGAAAATASRRDSSGRISGGSVGRWVTALAFDFQHFGQLFSLAHRNRRRNKRRNIKLPKRKQKKRDVQSEQWPG